MRRIVVSSDILSVMSPGEVSLRRRESHYVRHVLRLREGDEVELIDGRGSMGRGRVASTEGECVQVYLSEFGRSSALESPLEVDLWMGLPRGNRWDLVLQKSTELGVTRIQALYTSRGEVKIPENKVGERVERWSRIATEAARQCGRAVAPEIAAPRSLKQALIELSQVKGVDLQLMAWEEERQHHEERALETALASSGARRVVLLVGPEGGLSQAEARDCTLAGFVPVSLGPRVLRAETAAVVFTALVQYRLGDMA